MIFVFKEMSRFFAVSEKLCHVLFSAVTNIDSFFFYSTDKARNVQVA